MQTTSGVPAPTEDSAPTDGPSQASSTTDVTQVLGQLGQDTIQLRPMALRRSVPKPVFVDASGRNRRRLRILVAALVTPIVAYVALLISTLVGGPTTPSALLPKPPAAVAQPSSTPTPAKPHRHKAPAKHLAAAATPSVAGLHVPRTRSTATARSSATRTSAKGKTKPTATATPHPHPH